MTHLDPSDDTLRDPGTGGRRYLCTGCKREEKVLDQQDPDSVQSGCDTCERITTWVAHGTLAYTRRVHPEVLTG